MKRILCSLLGAILLFGSAFADAPKSKNAKVTLAATAAQTRTIWEFFASR